MLDQMKVIDVGLYFYVLPIIIWFYVVCFYNLHGKSHTIVSSLIKQGKKVSHEKGHVSVLIFNIYEINIYNLLDLLWLIMN